MKYGAVFVTLSTLVCMAAACTREYRPVCGSDGQTYSNLCLFREGKATNPALSMEFRGECNRRRARDVAIQIADEEWGVPGNIRINITDNGNNTSSQESNSTESSEEGNENIDIKINNITYYKEEAKKTKDVKNESVKFDGKARDKRAILACTHCNGDSKCLEKCTYLKSRHGINLKDNSEDSTVDEVQIREKRAFFDCPCPRHLRQICGTNGVTYANECLLKCAAKRNGRILKQHEGPCGKHRKAREVSDEETAFDGVNEAGKEFDEEMTKTHDEVEEHKDVEKGKESKGDVVFDFIPEDKQTELRNVRKARSVKNNAKVKTEGKNKNNKVEEKSKRYHGNFKKINERKARSANFKKTGNKYHYAIHTTDKYSKAINKFH